jgi:transposase
MWDGYIGAITEFIEEYEELSAQLVIDRFHVAQNYRAAFDTLRKQEMRRLKKTLSTEEYNAVAKGMLWVLRYNHRRLDKQKRQRLRLLFRYSPALHQAYTLREELTAIFNQRLSRQHARKRLRRWMAKVKQSAVRCYDKFLNTLSNHFDGIVNYFTHRANSGFVEGFNNKLKTLTRRCFGIKRLDTLVRRLRLDAMPY